MPRYFWKYWAAAGLSAGLLELPFPLAGPLPPARSIVAWFALVPLLWAVLSAGAAAVSHPKRRAFLLGYVCGVLWYAGNCYWVRDVMMQYGDMPPLAPTFLLAGFSLVLGLYFGLFALGVEVVRGRFGAAWALASAPFLWVAQELAGARITSVPWDQLGYSQIDNHLLTLLAPWTGVYGISFVLVAGNALSAGSYLALFQPTIPGTPRWRLKALLGGQTWVIVGGWFLWFVMVGGIAWSPPGSPTTATAVLVQPNLDVAGEGFWMGPGEWDSHMAEFAKLADEQCKTYIAGVPQTNAPTGEIVCPPYPTHPDLVAWPESPAPFFEQDPRFQKSLATIAQKIGAPMVVGNVGMDVGKDRWLEYNSALILAASGEPVGRYDKIHLVPFGEYVPFHKLLFFARKLTGKVGRFDRGEQRRAFLINGKRYGVFICYEAVFADEVREFARNGAEVLVNISDDGWYGDTSAPWQHLNMARMRAVENRRWILRDTNNGITAAIDPFGRVRQSIPRHRVDALPAQFGFRDDITFYTAHGDVFAWCCAILSIAVLVGALQPLRRKVQ
jgi:apolipoprotein N-acyltransferase